MVIIKKRLGKDPKKEEQDWDNPKDPEKAADTRDFEQLKRQAQEAERRKENLTELDKDEKDENS